ncbi:hypothetical protein SME36J_52840 (plasmid) [Serratia marcescens]|nr:hypothetical protein SME36J_52840 [Serratia marcescens]
MKIITAPQETALYPGLVASAIMDVRMKLGMSRIQLNYRKIFNQIVPMLVIDFFNDKGKLYTLRYNLPPDTAERTELRVSLLLHLLRKDLDVAGDAAA